MNSRPSYGHALFEVRTNNDVSQYPLGHNDIGKCIERLEQGEQLHEVVPEIWSDHRTGASMMYGLFREGGGQQSGKVVVPQGNVRERWILESCITSAIEFYSKPEHADSRMAQYLKIERGTELETHLPAAFKEFPNANQFYRWSNDGADYRPVDENVLILQNESDETEIAFIATN